MRKILILTLLGIFLVGCQSTGQAIRSPPGEDRIYFSGGPVISADGGNFIFWKQLQPGGQLAEIVPQPGGDAILNVGNRGTVQTGRIFSSGSLSLDAPRIFTQSDFLVQGHLVVDGSTRINSLAGRTNANACLNAAGELYRSMTPCV